MVSENSPNKYDKVITILTALQKSKNTVSAQIMDKLTPSAALEFLRNRLGVTSLVDADADYAAMALGQPSYGMTVREMAQAYTALANDGVFTYSRTYSMVKDRSGKIILDNQPKNHSGLLAGYRTHHDLYAQQCRDLRHRP